MAAIEFADVSGFLEPRSIAVVGASEQARNLGGVALRNLLRFGFPGSVWPVHPQGGSVAGLPAFRTLAELPEVPDLAILAIGAANIPAALGDCAAAGVRNVIVWAGGFVEGGEEGAARQREIAEFCRAQGIRLLGPNCLGTFNTALPLAASFASFLNEIEAMRPGGLSVVGQSGGLVTMAIEYARRAGLGFRHAVSTGNEAVLEVADFVAAFAEDPGTRIIAIYLEGIRDGARMAAALDLARARGKSVVVLRGGSTEAAARAALAHTGAVSGDAEVCRSVLEEFGAIEVRSLEELLDVVLQLSSRSTWTRMAGNGIAIVTFGGGSGVLSADQAASHGLDVPLLAEPTRTRLAPLLPPIASTLNPVDLTPQVYQARQWVQSFPDALDAIAADPGVDAVLLQYGPMATEAVEIAAMTEAFIDRAPIPVLLAWGLPPSVIPPWMAEHRIHVFEEFERAVRVLGRFAAASAASSTLPEELTAMAFDWDAHVPAIGTVSGADFLRLLDLAGFGAAGPDAAAQGAIRASVHRDPTFGPVVTVSLDTAPQQIVTHRAPVAGATAAAMLRRLRPGQEPDAALAKLISRFSAFGAAVPWRRFAIAVVAGATGVFGGSLLVEER